MISQIEVTGIHYEVGSDIKKYVTRKVGRLDRFVPRHARKALRAEIRLEERKTKSDKNQCEVVLFLPDKKTITAKEATINMFAAVDIVEQKLKNQLKKYKAQHGGDHQDHHGKLRRILRRRPAME